MKSAVYILVIGLGLGIPAGIGYYLGRQGGEADSSKPDNQRMKEEQSPDEEEVSSAPEVEKPVASGAGGSTAKDDKEDEVKAPVISPESLSKDKGVPATVKNAQGEFTLIAVVESVGANAKLTQSIQIVTAQRQQLLKLSQQFDKTPEASVQQRELIAGQINETRKSLDQNLVFMRKKYGYSLQNIYAYIPHKASLNLMTQEGDKAKSKLVYEFVDAESYQVFQNKRKAYLRLRIEQARAAQKAAGGDKKPGSEASGKPAKLEPTKEMKELLAEFQTLYNYDPNKNYRIDIEKAAFYARPAR